MPVSVVLIAGSGKLSAANRAGRDTTQLLCQADFCECPDDPLCGIELPGLHAIAIVVWKLMVIVMVAFAEGHQGHQP